MKPLFVFCSILALFAVSLQTAFAWGTPTINSSEGAEQVGIKRKETIEFVARLTEVDPAFGGEWRIDQSSAVLECGNPYTSRLKCMARERGRASVYYVSIFEKKDRGYSNTIVVTVEEVLKTRVSLRSQIDDVTVEYFTQAPKPYRNGERFALRAEIYDPPSSYDVRWEIDQGSHDLVNCTQESLLLMRCETKNAGKATARVVVIADGVEEVSNTLPIEVKSPSPQYTIAVRGSGGPQRPLVGDEVVISAKSGRNNAFSNVEWVWEELAGKIFSSCRDIVDAELTCVVASPGRGEVYAWFDTRWGRFSSNSIMFTVDGKEMNPDDPVAEEAVELEEEVNLPLDALRIRSNKGSLSPLVLRKGETLQLQALVLLPKGLMKDQEVTVGWLGLNADPKSVWCRASGARALCRGLHQGVLNDVRVRVRVGDREFFSEPYQVRVR